MNVPTSKNLFFSLALSLALGLAACTAPPASATPTNTEPASPTPVPPTPTDTPIPLALMVNGVGIPLTEFQAEVARYQSAQGALGMAVTLEQATQAVKDFFINKLLLAQGAASSGFVVDDATLQARIDTLATQIGGPEALEAWESQFGYTDATFRQSLRRYIAEAWMRDQIIASVPSTAEQVHIQQILLYNESETQEALNLLNNGAEFAVLAKQYDPVTHGELGWFPRGYLLEPAIEEAAFALQPGQYSGIVKSQVGYHILFLIERDPNHPLSPDALLTLQSQALENWLRQQREQSTIIFIP